MKPLILITNDDGVAAKGLLALEEVALEFGDVVVVAPGANASGKMDLRVKAGDVEFPLRGSSPVAVHEFVPSSGQISTGGSASPFKTPCVSSRPFTKSSTRIVSSY